MTPERFAVLQDMARITHWIALGPREQLDYFEELLVAFADANEQIRNQTETIEAVRREKYDHLDTIG